MWDYDDYDYDEDYPLMEALCDDNDTIGILEEIEEILDDYFFED